MKYDITWVESLKLCYDEAAKTSALKGSENSITKK